MTDTRSSSHLETIEIAIDRLSAEPLSEEARLALEEVRLSSTRLIEENRRLVDELQNSNLAKSKFVSVVTHELRLPMTSIKGYTDLLRAGVVGALNEQQSNFLNVIRNNTERMSVLVSDLSDLSHIESGRMKLNPVETRLASLLDDLLLLMRSRFDEKKQTLEVNLPADLPNLFVDSQRLSQVLTALLNNANKYSSEGCRVILGAAAQGRQVRIEVQDYGIGISSEDAPQVFNQFFRSEDPKVREHPGWGLNLCVARNMVLLMNGEIGFKSKVGEGSTFWVAVPACLTGGAA